MRVTIPNLEGKALFDYLVKNKADLIAKKCSLPIKSDPFCFGATPIKTSGGEKAESPDVEEGTIRVKVVCNTALFCDTYGDVLAPDCWKKSIAERGPKGKNLIPHLKNHDHEIDKQIGKVVDLFSEMIDLSILGYPASGKAQALIMISDVKKEWDEKLYTLYNDLAVRQHSIGLQYVQLKLALNDEDYKEEFAVWNAHYDSIINKEEVDRRNYFWWVSEIKLYENSAVLFGANELTPTLEVSQPSSPDTGKSDTDPEPKKLTSDQIKMQILSTNFLSK